MKSTTDMNGDPRDRDKRMIKEINTKTSNKEKELKKNIQAIHKVLPQNLTQVHTQANPVHHQAINHPTSQSKSSLQDPLKKGEKHHIIDSKEDKNLATSTG